MAYLLAKFTLLFICTALLSFVLGLWWARRRHIDVTESFTLLRARQDSNDSQWSSLSKRLDGLNASVANVVSEALRNELENLPQQSTAQVDLSGVNSQLNSIDQHISKLDGAGDGTGALSAQLEDLRQQIADIHIPTPPILGPLELRIAQMEEAVRQMPSHIKAAPADLEPTHKRLDQLEQTLRTSSASADYSAVSTRLSAMENAIRTQSQGAASPAAATDNAKVEARLAAIEALLQHPRASVSRANKQAMAKPIQASQPAVTVAQPASMAEPLLLESASHGKQDDLKLITGVGPKLEALLNEHGVYYFWQIADWSDADIATMDARLDTFKGRIQRDGWVAQAKAYAARGDTAVKPN